jgi:rare lipoprotein A
VGLQGRRTANGETFDQNALSAAHRTLPLPSIVEVTNLENNKRIVVRVNDRGPFAQGRIIDVSRAAARELGFESDGEARVSVRYIGPAPDTRRAQ